MPKNCKHPTCSSECRRVKPKLKKILAMPKLLAKAQSIFNCFIRDRDFSKGCISCGSQVQQAGHYFSQGHHSAYRFNAMNTNGQCIRCNMYLSGNLIKYRQGLVKRYGTLKVENFEIMVDINKVRKWTRIELDLIIDLYGKAGKTSA